MRKTQWKVAFETTLMISIDAAAPKSDDRDRSPTRCLFRSSQCSVGTAGTPPRSITLPRTHSDHPQDASP